MTKFIIKLATTMSLLMSSTGLFATQEPLDQPPANKIRFLDTHSQQTVFSAIETERHSLHSLPLDILRTIFAKASQDGVDPKTMTLICKKWYSAMYPKNNNQTENRSQDRSFMAKCVKLHNSYLSNLMNHAFLNCHLAVKTGLNQEPKKIFFSTSIDDTANLSSCEKVSEYLMVFTLNEDRLRMVGGANANKIIMFFSPLYKVKHLLPKGTSLKNQFSNIVIIWHDGNLAYNNEESDFLIVPHSKLNKANLLNHWKKSSIRGLSGFRNHLKGVLFGVQLFTFTTDEI